MLSRETEIHVRLIKRFKKDFPDQREMFEDINSQDLEVDFRILSKPGLEKSEEGIEKLSLVSQRARWSADFSKRNVFTR